MEMLKVNRSGFITNYLISGPREEDYYNSETDDNQLRYEQHLRTIVADWKEEAPSGDVLLGEDSSLGMPWRYYYQHGNWFVDESTFYSTLKKVELLAVTQIETETEREIPITVWSYAAVQVWCNGEAVCRIDAPVYKPIARKNAVLKLRQGCNRIDVRLQTLGVRDTRTLFGIQLPEGGEAVGISLPDSKHTDELVRLERWLDSAVIENSVLSFSQEAPQGARLAYDSQSPDFAQVDSRKEWMDISGQKTVGLDDGKPGVIRIQVQSQGNVLVRTVENILAQRPQYSEEHRYEENKTLILKRIASMESLSRGDKFGFAISNLLARKALGMERAGDRELLLETLNQIEDRYDCSDFLVCGLIRYMKNYELDRELENRAREVLLNWRYWMDQKGSDAMCFWSENHSLMFYSCAMHVGEMYPDAYFQRAGMTGRELMEEGRRKVICWLEDVETHGFEEFLSTVYMCVTFAALLNVVDYSEESISKRAAAVTDRLLAMLSAHTFDGVILAPMGRVYGEVVHPFAQGAQALMNLINPKLPYAFGEGWLGFYATSGYQIPEGLCELMEQRMDTVYTTGNARIFLNKQKNYCLTSVQSPRLDEGFCRWPNLTLDEKTDTSSCAYTKSLNERFHGTTCFEPGVYGYQQHMWYAALDKETDVFANHPGGTCVSSSMRPGYWYGNGVMPAVQQSGNMLGAVYRIPEHHSIHFTHLYLPVPKFDVVKMEGNWIFGRKKDGYLAVWCSVVMEPADDQLFGCEFRAYGDESAYVCICGDREEYGTFEEFEAAAQDVRPDYCMETGTLTAGKLKVIFTENHDRTQYI